MMAAENVVAKRRIQRKHKPRFLVIHGGKELEREAGEALSLSASVRFRARQLERRIKRSELNHEDAPERRSVAIAMLAVEERLVKAFWTIARQPLGSTSPTNARHCGLEYLHDREDSHARYADAPGGKWESFAPRPSLPSSKDIDAANEALDWLLFVDNEGLRRLLVIGATSKRGDAGRRINWIRLRPSLPEYAAMTVRTMQRRYQEALRIIVTEMTLARLSHVSHKSA